MDKQVVINIWRFVLLLLLQVVILNYVELHGYIVPYIYPLFILLLPLDTPRWLVVLLGFFMGLLVDASLSTPGLHTSATTLIAYLRKPVIKLYTPPSGYDTIRLPSVSSLGLRWFISYAAVLVLIHHFYYFFIEAFSLSYFMHTFMRVVASSFISLMLMLVQQWLFSSRKKV